MASITLTDLVKRYGDTEVLHHIAGAFEDGEFIVIVGPSGCGKSTVLNIIAGLYQASSGGVILDNKEVTEPGPERAVVFQNHSLLPWLSVYKNVELAVKQTTRARNKAETRDWVMHNLELVHMTHAIDKLPSEISGGMKQKMADQRWIVGAEIDHAIVFRPARQLSGIFFAVTGDQHPFGITHHSTTDALGLVEQLLL